MVRDLRVLEAGYSNPWAIRPDKLGLIVAVAQAHAAGLPRATMHGALEESSARLAARAEVVQSTSIGVIPIHGTIFPRGDRMLRSSGVATTEEIGAQVRAFVEDSQITAIVLDIDSPGGMVHGVPELAALIRESRDKKRIVAQVWDQAASAAYWLAAQASEIVVTPSGDVGSIGVLALYADHSRELSEAGIDVTLFRSVPAKAEFSGVEPLTDEARAHEQGIVEELHGEFVADVAAGRGVTAAKVTADFGQGRMVRAEAAVAAGMADRIGTFSETVQRIHAENSGRKRMAQVTRTLLLRRRRHRGTAAREKETGPC